MGIGWGDYAGYGKDEAFSVRSLVACLGFNGYKSFDCTDDDDDDGVSRIFIKVRLSCFSDSSHFLLGKPDP